MSEFSTMRRWMVTIDYAIGIFVAILCASAFGWMNNALHENRLWFSNIEQVEREISFRTESGLYYSYYKQLVEGDAKLPISDALRSLANDTKTESPAGINVIERFNIFQEIFLAITYRALNWFEQEFAVTNRLPHPIFFYVYVCFAFAGFATFCVFILTWQLVALEDEKSHPFQWCFGMLAAAWMFINYEDATRVFFSTNLRENYALPLFWLQNIFVVRYLGSNEADKTRLFAITISTFFFSALWQFNQFLLLIQSSTLLLCVIIFPKTEFRICEIIIGQSLGYLLLIVLQNFRPMLVTSFSNSLNLSILLSSCIFISNCKSKYWIYLILRVLFIIFAALSFNYLCTLITGSNADDSHIWSLLHTKLRRIMAFGAETSIIDIALLPFESNLYICHGAFRFIDVEFFVRTTNSGLLPVYVTLLPIIFYKSFHLLSKTFCPKKTKELAKDVKEVKVSTERKRFFIEEYHLSAPSFYIFVQSAFSAILAMFILRMKFFWLPQMAVISAYGVYLLRKVVGRHACTAITLAVSVALLARRYEQFQQEMANEQEFYDPDTVALMEWIERNTRKTAIFSGSMQLMAGVKCCTGRPIANHPHFEDKSLRDRTHRLYQIYGLKTPEDVHQILINEKVNYIIIEESICFIQRNGCTTNELIDLSNRELSESDFREYNNFFASNDFRVVNVPRFCSAVREFDETSTKLFQLVFQNHTFRVYMTL